MRFKDLCWNVDECSYRKDASYSYSILSKYLKLGFEGLSQLRKSEETQALIEGSIVDCLMTDADNFDNIFYIAKHKCPDSLIPIVEILLSTGQYYDTIPESSILTVAKNWQSNYKDETKLKKLKDTISEYYNARLEHPNHMCITQEMFDSCMASVMALKNSKATSEYFTSSTEDREVLYQCKFKGRYNKIPIRCMADIIIVDYKAKTIQISDLKTSSRPEYSFYDSFVKWNYDIQARLYTALISSIIANSEFKEFTILPFQFIVVNKNTLNPCIWIYDKCFEKGNIVINTTTLVDWRNILTELNDYESSNTTVPKGIKDINILSEFIK